jgi:fumarate reductase subunit D
MMPPLQRRHEAGHRRRSLRIAAAVHRVSGVLLALFLPLHFLALGLAIEGEERLDSFLRWSDQPIVKITEAGLIALLVVHLLGGVRVLAVENLPWRDGQKNLALGAIALGALAGLVFISRAF